VLATLRDLAAACGDDRPVALARELTKLHEQVRRGSLAEVLAALADVDPRGECVIVLGGAPAVETVVSEEDLDAALAIELASGASTRDAADAVSARLGVPRRAAYARAITLKSR
jgi:16S rRNA (cytidine1402-2'-O)-methyltransferase